MSVGVVIGRFQVPSLHEGHIAVLSAVQARCTHVVVLVGCAGAPANARDPLPFFCRRDAINSVFPNATVMALPDKDSDHAWSANIDAILEPVVRGQGSVTIYGGRDSCLPHYSGRYPATPIPGIETTISGAEIRKAQDLGYSYDFRQGMVWAMQAPNKFPTSFQTVDVAVCQGNMVLVGQKHEDGALHRFPGGFVDPSDATLEAAARRELAEECGINLEVTPPLYLGSCRIDDWRFRGSTDKILTSFFVCYQTFGYAEAGDDLARVAYVTRDNLRKELRPLHRPLVDLLERHWEAYVPQPQPAPAHG